MFRFANGAQDKLKALFTAMNGQRMDLVLAQSNFSIYFTQMHITDLKKVIEVDAAPQGACAAPNPQTTAKPPAAVPPARRLPSGLNECPYCKSPVRPDRLLAHIARQHSGRSAPPNTRRHGPKRDPSTSPDSSVRRCGCGRPVIPGDDYCYSCRAD
jgi:hypothetical protein